MREDVLIGKPLIYPNLDGPTRFNYGKIVENKKFLTCVPHVPMLCSLSYFLKQTSEWGSQNI